MNFKINFSIPPVEKSRQICYKSKIVSVGSCFAENLFEKLEFHKFQCWNNPFGILFQPLAIENLFTRILTKKFFCDEDFLFHNELWKSLEIHSCFSNPEKETLINQINNRITSFESIISKATHIIITLGTSWAYREIASGIFVANCHKLPQNKFQKKLLSVETIVNSLLNTEKLIREKNPNVALLFTISPVRHIKDGIPENQLSKSTLFVALHQFLREKSENNYYFPSYEILIDELRDYRFYADDMLHPSSMAIQYIWERFLSVFVEEETKKIMNEVADIQSSLRHKPLFPTSSEYLKFRQNLDLKIKKLQEKNPFLKF